MTFKVRAPTAKGVIVVYDFNNWNAHEHPMKKDDEGFWKVRVLLAPGRYEYKLLIDGRWWEDITGHQGGSRHFVLARARPIERHG